MNKREKNENAEKRYSLFQEMSFIGHSITVSVRGRSLFRSKNVRNYFLFSLCEKNKNESRGECREPTQR